MRKNEKKRSGVLPMTILNGFLILLVLLFGNLWMRDIQKDMKALRSENESKISSLESSIQKLNQNLEEEKQKVNELETIVAEQEKQEEIRQAEAEAGEMTMTLEELEPGAIVGLEQIGERKEEFFKAYEIAQDDAVCQRINGKSYRENNNIGLSDLRYLKVLHYNFEHQIQIGELIVNAAITEDMLNIFKELFDAEYEIQSLYLIDNYWTGDGDSSDSASIEENNSSAFCYRQITGGGSLSRHAYGCAIDINPQQNPYVWQGSDGLRWSHSNASPYIDRNSGDPHVIVKGDTCYSIFEKYGFSWGGNWSNPIDYQHFEKRL